MSSPKAPQFGATCTGCGKVRFTNRRAAKLAIKRMRGKGITDGHLNAYRCGEFWHIGHLPSAVIGGDLLRSDLDGPS